MVGEQHVSADPASSATTTWSRSTRATRAHDVGPAAAALLRERPPRAVLPLRRLLRDPPRLLRADLGARRALLRAARRAAGHARDAARHRGLQGQRARRSTTASARCSSALDEADLADDTLVILTTDHGMPFPGAKATLTDRGHRRAADHARPGGFHGGKVNDALVSQIDLFPTLCELAGIARPQLAAGPLAAAARAARDDRDQRRDLRRDDLPRRLRAAARDPHAALQVHPPLRRPRPARAAEHRRQPEQGPAARARAGRAGAAARGALRPRLRPRRGRATSSATPRTPTCWPSCAGGWTRGCARPATRCSTATCPRRPGAELNDPAGLSASEATRVDGSGAVR